MLGTRRSRRSGPQEEEEEGAGSRRRTRRSAASVESDEEDEDELPARRRSARSRKFLQESDGEDGQESGDESGGEGAARGRLRKRSSAKHNEDEAWDEEDEEEADEDDDEEDSWQRDAKEALSKLKKNRQCQDIFCEPVGMCRFAAVECTCNCLATQMLAPIPPSQETKVLCARRAPVSRSMQRRSGSKTTIPSLHIPWTLVRSRKSSTRVSIPRKRNSSRTCA